METAFQKRKRSCRVPAWRFTIPYHRLRNRTSALAVPPVRSPSVTLKRADSIVLNNEGAGGGWNGLWHYYHFTAEDTLGAIVGYAAVEPAIPEPDRLLVPYGMNWRDKWGLNEMIVEGMFPKRGSISSSKLMCSYCGAGSMG
jgi:hypothetical protein